MYNKNFPDQSQEFPNPGLKFWEILRYTIENIITFMYKTNVFFGGEVLFVRKYLGL